MTDREGLKATWEAGKKQEQVGQDKSHHNGQHPMDVTARTLHVRYIVAGNPNTPKEVLAKLANDIREPIRRRVAENPRTPLATLLQLAADPSIEVRLSVAENPNAPPEVLEQLAHDDDVDVRYGVAENPHIPVEYLKWLSEDDNPYVACRARKTLSLVLPV